MEEEKKFELIHDEVYKAGDFNITYNETYNEITITKRNGKKLYVIPVVSNTINIE